MFWMYFQLDHWCLNAQKSSAWAFLNSLITTVCPILPKTLTNYIEFDTNSRKLKTLFFLETPYREFSGYQGKILVIQKSNNKLFLRSFLNNCLELQFQCYPFQLQFSVLPATSSFLELVKHFWPAIIRAPTCTTNSRLTSKTYLWVPTISFDKTVVNTYTLFMNILASNAIWQHSKKCHLAI